jgi:hypothetical protein
MLPKELVQAESDRCIEELTVNHLLLMYTFGNVLRGQHITFHFSTF